MEEIRDGNSLNNRLDNLAWGTPSENALDRTRHGTNNHAKIAKLTKEQVREIRDLYATGQWRKKKLAQKYGVSQRLIAKIVNNQIWKGI